MNIRNYFSNREISIGIWIIAFIIFCTCKAKTRVAFLKFIKSAFSKKLVFLYIGIYTYLFVIIYLMYKISFWNINLLKDTIIWLITVPIVSVVKSSEDVNYFKDTIKSCFEIYILIEFLGLEYPFSIPIEIILVPTVLLFALAADYAEKIQKDMRVATFLNLIVAIIGVVAFVHAIKLAIADYKTILSLETIKSIVYVPILTILYIPFTYLILVFMKYETLYFKIDNVNYITKENKKKIKADLLKENKFILSKIKKVNIQEYLKNKAEH